MTRRSMPCLLNDKLSLWVALAGIAESSTSPTTVSDDYLFDQSFKNVPNGY